MLICEWTLSDAHLSKLQQGLKRSTRILIFSSSPKDKYGMMRSRPWRTLGLERTNGVLIWSSNMTSWSLSPVSSRFPLGRQTRSHFNQIIKIYVVLVIVWCQSFLQLQRVVCASRSHLVLWNLCIGLVQNDLHDAQHLFCYGGAATVFALLLCH